MIKLYLITCYFIKMHKTGTPISRTCVSACNKHLKWFMILIRSGRTMTELLLNSESKEQVTNNQSWHRWQISYQDLHCNFHWYTICRSTLLFKLFILSFLLWWWGSIIVVSIIQIIKMFVNSPASPQEDNTSDQSKPDFFICPGVSLVPGHPLLQHLLWHWHHVSIGFLVYLFHCHHFNSVDDASKRPMVVVRWSHVNDLISTELENIHWNILWCV